MKRIPTIKAVMTPFPYSIDIGEAASTAREILADHGVRHLPVTENGSLVSVVSEQDLRLAESRPDAEILTVRDVCGHEAYVVDLDERLDVVLATMARRRLHCALVVKQDRLAGIFTTTDACALFASHLRELFPSGGDEAA